MDSRPDVSVMPRLLSVTFTRQLTRALAQSRPLIAMLLVPFRLPNFAPASFSRPSLSRSAADAVGHASAQTFSNSTSIAIPNPTFTQGPASPYPSAITVSGVGAQLTSISVTLAEFFALLSGGCGCAAGGSAGTKRDADVGCGHVSSRQRSQLYLQQHREHEHAERRDADLGHVCADEFRSGRQCGWFRRARAVGRALRFLLHVRFWAPIRTEHGASMSWMTWRETPANSPAAGR